MIRRNLLRAWPELRRRMEKMTLRGVRAIGLNADDSQVAAASACRLNEILGREVSGPQRYLLAGRVEVFLDAPVTGPCDP
jgi:hypothetical protein